MKVYLLSHRRNDEELDGYKVIGIFSSEDKAKESIRELKAAPGFRDYPDLFHIDGYEMDKTFWRGGFG